jgi:NAD-dependent deacetylase
MKIVVLSGAGISAPSGLRTFRDAGGLWENHRVEDVATPEAWTRNPELVLRFYNERRAQLASVRPNAAHLTLSVWERDHEVVIITQNVDDLHERAGSTRIIHLHGELVKARGTCPPAHVINTGYNAISLGDRCPAGSQLRPHIVWFGEAVPAMAAAEEEISNAHVVLVVGTSLQVYPAAGLANAAPHQARRFLVDPNPGIAPKGYRVIAASAEIGVPQLTYQLEA